MTTIGTFNATLYGENHNFAIIEEGVYAADKLQTRLGIISDDGEPWCTLTSCVPGVQLGPGEFLVKTYSENAPVAKAVLESGIMADTGRRIPSHHVELEVWRIAFDAKV